MTRAKRRAERMGSLPANALADLTTYVERTGAALLAIRFRLEQFEAPGDLTERELALVNAVRRELSCVDAVMPDDRP